jgi:hypothetical protein
MRTILITLVLSVALVKSVSAQTLQDSTTKKVTFSYRYPGSGLGPDPTVHIIHSNAEKTAASRIILDALQSVNLSIVNLGNGVTLLQPDKSYQTDTSSVSAADIQSHNTRNPLVQLPARHYAVKYLFLYKIDAINQEIDFNVSTILVKRGGAGPWSVYTGAYSGFFFSKLIIDKIKRKMDELYPVATH